MKTLRSLICLIVITTVLSSCNNSSVYTDPNADVEDRIEDLLSQMTLDEKIEQLSGMKQTGFDTKDNERLGIPGFHMTDGPIGIRWNRATAFPSGISLAATWDTALATRFAEALAREASAKGRNFLLGPCVNINRFPAGGRNFESYGEDPYLTSRLAVNYIKALQLNDVIVCIKHFALNNQEWRRTEIDVQVDERTMREIYLPAFEAAVKEAEVYSVMSAYNKVNGWWCSENDMLLNKILKEEWGFRGLVVSDWESTHNTISAANHGLDLEMPSAYIYTPAKLKQAVTSGKISEKVIDDKVRRILRVKFESNMFDGQQEPFDTTIFHSARHKNLALEMAVNSMVLLKNEHDILPLDLNKLKTIAVIGPMVNDAPTGGGGSSHVTPYYKVSPMQGIHKIANGKVKILYASGTLWPLTPTKSVSQESMKTDEKLIEEAVKVAKAADVALLFVGTNDQIESEGFDRTGGLQLLAEQDKLISAVAAANPRSVVVMYSGTTVLADKWLSKIPAMVQAFFPGQEGGNAIAQLLFGKENFSGKLPFSYLASYDQSPAYKGYMDSSLRAPYSEGIYVGYRYLEKNKLKPQFPFGYGLSYTTFEYKGLVILKTGDYTFDVSLKVQNTGTREGSEIVQLYVAPNAPAVDRPLKELKGFAKVKLQPGEEKTVTFKLNKRSFSRFDAGKKGWIADPGNYDIIIGASSADDRLTKRIRIK